MANSSPMKMPEWLVFLRASILGAVLAEIWQIGFLSSKAWGQQLSDDSLTWRVIVLIPTVTAILIIYAYKRGVYQHAKHIVASRRVDLGALVLAGVWIVPLLRPQLAQFHEVVSKLDIGWSQAMLLMLLITLMSPVVRSISRHRKPDLTQLYFLSDSAIDNSTADALNITKQATDFADTVLTSSAHSEMIFGLDGPWGVGKTSFLKKVRGHPLAFPVNQVVNNPAP